MIHLVGRLTRTTDRNRDCDFMTLRAQRRTPADCQSAQGKGLGSFLLIDALRRAQHLAEHNGVRAVEVDAIDDAARRFYLRYEFVALKDDRRHLFLPMTVIRKLRLPPLA